MAVSKFRAHDPAGSGYTVIWNDAAVDPVLSAKAKGVLWYLLTRPEDWDVYEGDIVKHMKDGLRAVRSAVKELLAAAYMTRKRLFRENGQFDGWQYDVFHKPVGDKVKLVLGGNGPVRKETVEQLETLADLAAIESAECGKR